MKVINTFKEKIEQKRKIITILIKSLGTILNVAPYQVVFLLLVILIQGIIPAIAIKLTSFIIDNVNSIIYAGFSVNNHLFESNQKILTLVIFWGGALLLKELFTPLLYFFQGNIADKAVYHINKSIIEKSLSFKKLYILESQDFHNDVEIIKSQSYSKPLNLTVTLIGLIKDFVIIISCLTLLLNVLFFVSFFALISAYIGYKVFSRIQEKTWYESLGRSPDSRKMNYISSVAISPNFAKESKFFKINQFLNFEFTKIFNRVYSRMFHLRKKQIYLSFLPLTISIIGNVLVFYVLLDGALSSKFSIGNIALLLQTMALLHISVGSFGEQLGWVHGHLIFFDKYFNFLELKEEYSLLKPKMNSKSAYKHLNKPITIAFENVSFSYPKTSSKVLHNMSFTIKPKEKVAIVGKNGAGKSTLIKLLCGLYNPTEGQIKVNNILLSSFIDDDWRSHIAPVFQDFSQYYFDIKTNITMGSEDNCILMKDIIKEVQLESLIRKLPKGVESNLGKLFGGIELSGGEWQKISIARALFKQSEIYLLDEPTSSLDPLIEHEIYTQFQKICEDNTVIFVTHRLGSIIMADKILLIDNGHLIASGTHSELMLNCGIYRNMFHAQSKGYIELHKSWKKV